jgi:alkanesulfonate monooxygenase SsuD/methylene tetrahydromethanopterin reductase-like flavin-dependent oxidoreductase (luciferase family)
MLNPHVTDPKVGSVRHVIVADTDEEAERIGRRAWTAYHRNFPKRGYEDGADPTTGAGGGAPGGPSLGGNFDLALKVEASLAGSPATVGAFVERYRAESEMNYFVGAFQWGDITHSEAMRSMELFGAAAIA